ncbi:transposase [Streptomyces lonegramiae]|uniref:transposase n=1 Tax=Streptomyces lonegramiae TaxID=3075524 RepID=UPI00374E0198
MVPDHSRQAKSGGGFDKSAFAVDWDNEQVTCARGQVSRNWGPLRINGHDYIQVRFDKATCLDCSDRPQCTTSATRPRALVLLPTRELHEIQTRNRVEQQTEAWQRCCAIRSGIEAAVSQNVRTCGMRQIPLPRSRQNARTARPDRAGLQPHPHRRLGSRAHDHPPPGQHASTPCVRPPHDPRRSPTESWYCV